MNEKKVTTLGEARVRTDFNVGGTDNVSNIKNKAAELIDLINSEMYQDPENPVEEGEFFRLKSLAMTAIEEGAMWEVKAVTIK